MWREGNFHIAILRQGTEKKVATKYCNLYNKSFGGCHPWDAVCDIFKRQCRVGKDAGVTEMIKGLEYLHCKERLNCLVIYFRFLMKGYPRRVTDIKEQ